jgi:pimeloyl-ACP methyl ester carboxylesterase
MMISSSRSDTTDSVTSADGTVIGYRQMGTGPGLILVHGGMQSSRNLMKLGAALSDSFTLYIPDRRGRGLSGSFGETYSVEKACEDMGALLAKTGATNVFGLSAGALISLWAALKIPGLRKVALYEPPLSVNGSYSMAWVNRYDREIAQGRLASAFITVLKGVKASPVLSLLPRFILAPLFKVALRKENKTEGDGTSLKVLIPTMHFDAQIVIESTEKIEQFSAIKADILLLGGSKSPTYLQVALNGLSRVLSRSKRVIFRGLDHLGPDNSGKPEVVAQDVVLLISWHILVQIIWHTRSFLAVPADPGKRLKLHIASEYAFPKPFHTRFATGAPNNKLRSVPDNARSNNLQLVQRSESKP